MKKRISHLLILTAMLGAVSYGIFHIAATAEAETYTTTTSTVLTYPIEAGCLILPYSLGIGSSGSSVLSLQNFLNQHGYMSYQSTGYYGVITFSSVARFQAAHGISAIGYVGPLTRARIQAVSCDGITPTPKQVSIYTISPSAGPVGTSVTITGTGFTDDNTIYFAGGAIQHVPATTVYTYGQLGFACNGYPNCSAPLQSITFTIPEAIGQYCAPGMYCTMLARMVTPGTYDISVGNDTYGKSNALQFTVTGGGVTGVPISISGIEGPHAISMTVPGTWTVRTNSIRSSTLRYSVSWGDELYASTASAISAPVYDTMQGSATFTHVYQRAGIFNPTFTVSNSYGNTATASMSVSVNPIY